MGTLEFTTHDEQNNSSDTGSKVPMTHDELLDYLREHEEYWTSLRAQRWAKVPAFNALRAVVELHKPWTATEDDRYWGGFRNEIGEQRCLSCDMPSAYPCPTIQAIEKELN